MSRVTFQFVPERGDSNTDPLTHLEKRNEFEETEKFENGFSELKINSSNWVEVGGRGDIRYTTKEFDSNSLSITEIFNDALSLFGELIVESDTDYRVCLLIGDSDPVDTYLGNKNLIREFGRNMFCDENPSYTELNKDTVKLTFQKNSSLVRQNRANFI